MQRRNQHSLNLWLRRGDPAVGVIGMRRHEKTMPAREVLVFVLANV
jgi:hypothetical protein